MNTMTFSNSSRCTWRWLNSCRGLVVAVVLGLMTAGLSGEDKTARKTSAPEVAPAPLNEVSVASARERAKLLHDVYTTTLEVIHRHYFRRDGPVLPARAMDEVFEEMARLSGGYANWIAVNTKAMSIDHEPTTEFEKQAATELAAGKEEYEVATKTVYRRATRVPLASSCVGCHTKMFAEPPKTPRFAGLVISISLKQR